MPLALAGMAGFAILMIAVGVAMSGSPETVASRLQRYASAQPMGGRATAQRESAVIAGLSKVIDRQDMSTRLATELARADLKMKPAEFLVVWAITPVFFLVFAFALGMVFPALKTPPALFVFFVLGLLAPRTYLRRRKARRLNEFNKQLPDVITLLANSLRAGSSFLQGVEMVSREARPPISEEFGRVLREMNLGVSMEAALANLVRRVSSEDLELMITAISIQSQVGGNLASVLDAIAFTIRERVRIKGDIKTLTAQQRYSGYVITLLPIGLGGLLFLVSPSYITPMFERPPELFGLPMGVVFFLIGGVSMAIGGMLIRRVVDIKV
ncbi:MAG: type II secretion system F family protein [Chloroflexota bacterium]|nr:type II secretion system F family protein [Chloroflexota bacterium]